MFTLELTSQQFFGEKFVLSRSQNPLEVILGLFYLLGKYMFRKKYFQSLIGNSARNIRVNFELEWEFHYRRLKSTFRSNTSPRCKNLRFYSCYIMSKCTYLDYFLETKTVFRYILKQQDGRQCCFLYTQNRYT